MRNLPLGISDFSTIRNPSRNFIYIDKTAQIAEMVRMFPAVFIARPRRFGKSLLASTLRDLFGKGIEGFEGLDIAKTWTDTTYKVVSLDFSAFRDVGTLEDFLLAFDLHLQGRLRAAGIPASALGDSAIVAAEQLARAAHQRIRCAAHRMSTFAGTVRAVSQSHRILLCKNKVALRGPPVLMRHRCHEVQAKRADSELQCLDGSVDDASVRLSARIHGRRTSNQFFNLARAGIGPLRHVTRPTH